MSAPKDLIKRQEWKRKISISLKGRTPWNKDKNKVKINCQWCNKEFETFLSKIKYGRKYCSFKCKCKAISLIWKGKNRPPFSEKWRKNMSKAQKGRKLSAERIKKLKQRIPWNKGIPWDKKTKIKISQGHLSKNGGIRKKKQERNDSAYWEWRLNVWKRDNFKCRINNQDCKGRIIAHHILPWRDFPELRYEINNGITLCQAHHPRVRAEEKQLIPIFQGLVSLSNGKL